MQSATSAIDILQTKYYYFIAFGKPARVRGDSRTVREWGGFGEDVHWDNQSATGDIFTSDTKNIACAGCLVVCLLQDVFYLPMGG